MNQPDTIEAEIQKFMEDGLNSIDAITEFAYKHGIEIEVMADFVQSNYSLLSSVREDAEDLNLVERDSRLPL